jgi:nucleotide-binding universal stress UspA family protein
VYSTIAVGTDGSETAAEAVRQAADLAKRYDAKLVLLSAFKDAPPADASDETQWAHNPAAQTREILTRAESQLSDEGIDCRTIVDEGDAADVLIKLADECDADLLVIGNKGHQRRVLGSVPRDVVQHADCSVFIVKTT